MNEAVTPVMLIDLSSIYWPAYKSTAGVDVGHAVQSTLQRVRHLAAKYPLCAVAIDAGRSFRREISPDYKANRERDAVAVDQQAKLKEILSREGLPFLEVKGYEADDVLATAARAVAVMGSNVLIATADKDLAAVADRGGDGIGWIHMWNTTADAEMGVAELEEKFGVPPRQMPDYLALIGDVSDNIPGVRGVGPVTARKWLHDFGSLDGIIKAASQSDEKTGDWIVTPPAARTKLVAAIADGSLELSRKLVALVDVPGLDVGVVFRKREVRAIPPTEELFMEERANEEPTQVIDVKPVQPAPPAPADKPAPEAPREVTDLVLISPDDPRYRVALEPRNLNEAWKIAKAIVNSRAFPGIANPETAWLVISMGRELGIGAITAMRTVHIMEGKMVMHAALIVGLVLRSGKADYFKCIHTDNDKATWKTHRRGDPDPQALEITFTQEDRQRAKLGTSSTGKPTNWDKYPATMLRWRAATELARAVYPDVVFNLYSPDELGADMEPEVEK